MIPFTAICPQCERACHEVDREYPYHFSYYNTWDKPLTQFTISIRPCIDGVNVLSYMEPGEPPTLRLPKNWIIV